MWILKDLLQSLPPGELEEVRKTLRAKIEEPVARLAQRLDNSERTRKLFAGLSPEEKHVVRYLFSQGGNADETEITENLPESAPVLPRLKENLLIFLNPDGDGTEKRSWVIPREFSRFVPLTPSEKSTLANLLLRQPPAFDIDLAHAQGWAPATRQDQTVALKQKWLQENKLNEALDTLSDDEKALWKVFLDADGIVDIQLLHRHSAQVSVQPGQLDVSRPLDRLYALGLVFPNHLPNPSCFIVPSDVFATLRHKNVAPLFIKSENPPAQLRSWGLRILSDLQLYAAYQASGRLQFTQNDIPLRHQLRAFLKALGVEEENYGLFLNFSLGAFVAKVLKRENQPLEADPAESMSQLIAFWRGQESWQESSHWKDIHRSADGQIDKTLKSKRLVVLKALEDLPTKEWIAYSEFSEHVFARGWKRVEDTGAQSNSAFYHNERWPRREFTPDLSSHETLAAMIAESLTWLGMVDVGVGKGKKDAWELTHLRLTDWGRQFLDKKSGRFEPLPSVPAETHFRVLPNLEIQASPRLSADLLTELFRIAVLKGVHSFSLTKQSLRETLDEGRTGANVIEFLKIHSASPVPPIVEQFIDEVSQKHGHIKLGIAGAFLEVDDPLLLVELRAQRSLQAIFRKQVGDRLMILNDSELEKVAKSLRKLGYLPIIEKSAETERLKTRFHW